MSILEQLKQEAAAKQQQQQAQVDVKALRTQRYQEVILPTMQTVFGFMKELVQHLNFLEHAVTIDNYSEQYPQFGRLTQKDYKVYTDNFGGLADFDKLMQVNIRFFCLGNGTFSYNIDGQSRIEQEVAFLTARNVPFDWKLIEQQVGLQSACFTVTRKIPVRFKFEVDYDASKIKLLINNHENFIAYQKTFEPETVNSELLDEIARYMLRKDSDFIRLEISSSHRQAIRELAEQAKREQDALFEKAVIQRNHSTSHIDPAKPILSKFKKLVGLDNN